MTAALEGDEWLAARSGRNLTPGKPRYPFYRRLGGPEGRSGRVENLVPTGIRPRNLYSFLTSVKNEGGWSTSCPIRFSSEKQPQCLFYRKGVGPRNVLDGFWRIENPLPPLAFFFLVYLDSVSLVMGTARRRWLWNSILSARDGLTSG